METKLRQMGLKCAVFRTLILGAIILFFLSSARDFDYRGLSFIMPNIIIICTLSIAIIYTWICALRGGPFRAIQQYCDRSENPEETMRRLERAWENKFATKNCLVSDEYLIWARKLHAVVIPIKDIYGIDYVHELLWEPGLLIIYLKDNTIIRLAFSESQKDEIEKHIKQNVEGIVIGKNASSRLLKVLVGKINMRYRVVKIRRRYFIVDYASPSKLGSYLSFAEKYRFDLSKPKGYWRAWEIPEQEWQNTKLTPFREVKPLSVLVQTLLFGFAIVVVILLARTSIFDVLPVNDFFGGQGWVAFLIVAAIVVLYFIYINIRTRIDTTKYTEVYISRNSATYTKMQLFCYAVSRIAIFTFLFWMVVDMFNNNTDMFVFVIYVIAFFINIFIGVWSGAPTIDSRSTIHSAEEVNIKQNSE